MSSGGSYDYKFGTKNNWRRTVWNRIKDGLVVPVREANVIYLAGSADLDRDIAIKKGFRPLNLFAVDCDRRVVSGLRGGGALAIHGDLVDVLDFWASIRVDVVFADLCCGMTRNTVKMLVFLAFLTGFEDAVIAINLLRGRDLIHVEGDTALASEIYEEKHRGKLAVMVQRYQAASILTGDIRMTRDKFEAGSKYPDAKEVLDQYREFLAAIHQHTPPWYGEYKSTSGQFFDSAVFRNQSITKMNRLLCPDSNPLYDSILKFSDNSHQIGRQLTAIRAVRTRKFNELN